MTEIWRIIPSYPDYAASNLGRIKRVSARSTKCSIDQIMKQHLDKMGYYNLTVMKPNSNSYTPRRVNRLVCEAFHGIPAGSHIHSAHLDGNPKNNKSDNLMWKTPKDNAKDKLIHGTHLFGSRAHNAKLNEEKVREIRTKRASGYVWRILAEEYGVSIRAVRGACSKTWTHV